MTRSAAARAWARAGRSWRAAIALAALASPPALDAQVRSSGGVGGNCRVGRGFECSFDARTWRGEQGLEWSALELVVIWRVPDSLATERRTQAMNPAIMEAYRAFAREAEARGRGFSGGASGAYFTAMAQSGMHRLSEWVPGQPSPPESLFVADSAFELPANGADSMLVVLVDGVYTAGGPPPRVLAALRLPSPSRETGARQWTNGDTTFIVRPRGRGVSADSAVRAIPEVRAFLERPRSP